MRRLRRVLSVVVVLVVPVGVAACDGSSGSRTPAPEQPAAVGWTEAAPLPSPAGWRVAVRDATWCEDRWLVVGGYVRAGGPYGDVARPAAWTSSDGTAWRAVDVDGHAYYAQRAVLSSVACRDGAVAAVGAWPGGAHGYPRVATFRAVSERRWTDVPAPYTQYGGSHAVNVGPVAAGDDGWLITGNRASGPAAWVAASPRRFTLVEGAPGLADRGDARALAHDAVWDGDSWTMVGGGSVPGGPARSALAWVSPDGRRWTPEPLPPHDGDAGDGYADAMAVTVASGGVLAVGQHDDGFGTWVRADGTWRAGEDFGERAADGREPVYVTSLAATGDSAWAAVSDGETFQVWTGAPAGTGWHEVRLPRTVAVAGDHAVVIAAGTDHVLLVADGGAGARAWTAPASGRA